MVIFPVPRSRELFTGTATAQFIMLQNERGLRDFQGNSARRPEKLDWLLACVRRLTFEGKPIAIHSTAWKGARRGRKTRASFHKHLNVLQSPGRFGAGRAARVVLWQFMTIQVQITRLRLLKNGDAAPIEQRGVLPAGHQNPVPGVRPLNRFARGVISGCICNSHPGQH